MWDDNSDGWQPNVNTNYFNVVAELELCDAQIF